MKLKRHPYKALTLARALLREGPLKIDGWWRSAMEGRSVDAAGRPLPWLTYGAIDFLSRRLPPLENVFEYGSGMGTLWWAERARRVVAVEHDAEWRDRLRPDLPGNAEILLRGLADGTAYVDSVGDPGLAFDVIVVDGRRRAECLLAAPAHLTGAGVVILDNSDREAYRDSMGRLRQAGFREVFFTGFCPVVNFKSETAIFYREGNLLGL